MRRYCGLTLVELLVAIAVFAIVASLAVPGFRDFVQNNRTSTQANELVSALNLARTEAVRRGSVVTVCPANDNADDCANDWTNGWLVFVDNADPGDTPEVDEVLRIWEPLPSSANIDGGGNGAPPTELQFRGLGDVEGAGGSFRVHFDGCTGDNARRIAVNAVGRPSVTREDC